MTLKKSIYLFIILFLATLITGCAGTTPSGATLNYYFGQFHSHTDYSDGAGTPEEAFAYARDIGHADFFAITDHSHHFDSDDYWRNSQEWAALKRTADDFTEDNRFVAIAGFEMTWSATTGHWGHINTFNTAWFESRTNPEMDLPAYYEKIASDPYSISQWNHPGTIFGDFADFKFYKNTDRAMKLIEVGNGEGAPGTGDYHPSYAYYTRALDKGWHVAPSNNQDNHHQNWITANDCRTVVLAPALTRNNIFNAVKNLKVYATEDKNLKVSFTVNGFFMGTRILPHAETLKIEADVEDSDMFDHITRLELVADGGAIAASEEFDSSHVIWTKPVSAKYKYYYLKATEADGDIAVTAPVWTGY